MSLTKLDLIELVYMSTGFSKKESAEFVEGTFEILKETLSRGETVKISGFGNFVVKEKKGRAGRNPQTGEAITITARKILTYKPSNILRQMINKAK